MSTVWIVSLVLAWVMIVLLTVAVVSLLRQLGELRAGLAPAPGVVGAQLYDQVPRVELPTAGGTLALAGPMLLVMHQRGCPTCADVERALDALAGEAPEARLVSVQPGRPAAAVGVPVVALEDLPPMLRPAAIPALVGISREGAVCAIGQASTLSELREAADATAGAVLTSGPGARRAMSWGACVPYWEAARRRASSVPNIASAASPPATSSGSSGSA
jgi:hypothetical protein